RNSSVNLRPGSRGNKGSHASAAKSPATSSDTSTNGQAQRATLRQRSCTCSGPVMASAFEIGGEISKMRRMGDRSTRGDLPGMPPACRFLAVDSQGQALGAAAGLDELGKLERPYVEAKGLQRGRELGRPFIEHDRAADHDGVATERDRLFGRYFDEAVNAVLEDRAAVLVEGARVI